MINIEDYREPLEKMQSEIGINFSNQELLFRCLVHDSYAYENEEIKRSNERLEFLGDSVLGLAVSNLLFNRHPNWNEGEMALYKSRLVSTDYLADRARSINLGSYIFLGRGEQSSGGRNRTSILADCLEAFIGALYLDKGFDGTYRFVEGLYSGCLDETTPPKDYKSCLQEYSQKVFKTLPQYLIIGEEGPPHRRVFQVKVRLLDNQEGEGTGLSKKDAEQQAARSIMEIINSKETGTVKDEKPECL